jgi:hypothetical protein
VTIPTSRLSNFSDVRHSKRMWIARRQVTACGIYSKFLQVKNCRPYTPTFLIRFFSEKILHDAIIGMGIFERTSCSCCFRTIRENLNGRWRTQYKLNVLLIVYQYNETNVMHFSFNLLRMKSLYMFRALFAHPQEAPKKRQLVYCVRGTSVGCPRTKVKPENMTISRYVTQDSCCVCNTFRKICRTTNTPVRV